MGRRLETEGLEELLLRKRRASALGRRGVPMPGLRQLHDGVPHVLLHDRRGRHRPHRRASAERTRVWDSCFNADFSYIHGGSVRAVDAVALPAVDDPQAGHLAGPVRHRRAASDAGAASRGAPSASTSPRRPRRCAAPDDGGATRRLTTIVARGADLRGPCRLPTPARLAGCAANGRLRRRRDALPRGRAGRHVLRRPPRPRRARAPRPGRGA